MGSRAFASILLVAAYGIFLVSADHGCQTNADCGDGNTCDGGICDCTRKDYVYVHDAKPMCQKIANLKESCMYSAQCQESSAGKLSRCNKGKCECYDTEKNDRDKVWDYQGTCYRAVDLNNGKCVSNEQCKASIAPSEYVQCIRDHEGANTGKCKCMEGKKCEERSGATGVHAGVATIGLLLFTAMKVVL